MYTHRSIFMTAQSGNNPMSIKLMNVEISVVYPHNGLLLNPKKEGSTDAYYNMEEP
jgi:hypothetical protein